LGVTKRLQNRRGAPGQSGRGEASCGRGRSPVGGCQVRRWRWQDALNCSCWREMFPNR